VSKSAEKLLSSRYVLQADAFLKLAERSGQTMPSVMYMVAPTIQKIAIQARILKTWKHPVMKWLLIQGFSLRMNQMLHEIPDPILQGSILATVGSAIRKQQEIIKQQKALEAEAKTR